MISPTGLYIVGFILTWFGLKVADELGLWDWEIDGHSAHSWGSLLLWFLFIPGVILWTIWKIIAWIMDSLAYKVAKKLRRFL